MKRRFDAKVALIILASLFFGVNFKCATSTQKESTTKIILLTLNSQDDTVDYFKSLFQKNNIAYTTLLASEVSSADFSNAIIIAGFSKEPSEYSSVSNIISASVSNGSNMIAEGFGRYILSYAGIGSASQGTWYPVVQDKYAFVNGIDQSSLFNNVAVWDPPTLPDRSEQYIFDLTVPGPVTTCDYVLPATGVNEIKYWLLYITYGWTGQNISSSYCESWGGCTSERSVGQASIKLIKHGSGTIMPWFDLPVIAGRLALGPVADKIFMNFINSNAPLQNSCYYSGPFDDSETNGLLAPGPCATEILVSNAATCAAGLTKEGRICTLWYPHIASHTLVPYYTQEPDPSKKPLLGVNEKMGSFAGIKVDTETFHWLHELAADCPYYSDWGVSFISYTDSENRIKIEDKTFAVPNPNADHGLNVIVRKYKITNEDTISHTVAFSYYSCFDVNDEYQLFPELMQWGHFIGDSNKVKYNGNSLVWNATSSSVHGAIAVGSDQKIESHCIGEIGEIDVPLKTDAFDECETQSSCNDTEFTSYLALANGYLGFDLGTIPPNDSKEISIYIAISNTEIEALGLLQSIKNSGSSLLLDNTIAYWDGKLAQAYLPGNLTAEEEGAYQTALMTILMSRDGETGAISAGPVTQPQYYPNWGRDSTFSAVALALADYQEEAKKQFDTFLNNFHERTGTTYQGEQCFTPDYHYAGVPGTGGGPVIYENDQIPTVLWGIWVIGQCDDEWFKDRWPLVKEMADFWCNNQFNSLYGLAGLSCDFLEDPSKHIRTSLYTNSAAVRGLRCSAELASKMNDSSSASSYREKANRIVKGIQDRLTDKTNNTFYDACSFFDSFCYHDLGDSPGDQIVIAWPFYVLPFNDNTVKNTANCIESYIEGENSCGIPNRKTNSWLPMRLMTVPYWIKIGQQDIATSHLKFALDNRTSAGWIPENVSAHKQKLFAKPLIWAQAMLILNLLELKGDESHKIPVPQDPQPPSVDKISKLSSPFRIKISGSNLQSENKVFINGTEWIDVTWKSIDKIVLKGGSSLKSVVPKNTPTTFRFVNPDGGELTVTWQWP